MKMRRGQQKQVAGHAIPAARNKLLLLGLVLAIIHQRHAASDIHSACR